MEKEKIIYQNIVNDGIYDRRYNFMPQVIDGKVRATSLGFAMLMVEEMTEKGIKCKLISTDTKKGYECSVIYYDSETNELLVANPTTDIKMKNDSSFTILDSSNWHINLQDYINTHGPISVYNYILESPLIESDSAIEIREFLTSYFAKNDVPEVEIGFPKK